MSELFVPPHDKCDCRQCLEAKISWQAERIRILEDIVDTLGKLKAAAEAREDAPKSDSLAPYTITNDEPDPEEPDPAAYRCACGETPRS